MWSGTFGAEVQSPVLAIAPTLFQSVEKTEMA